MKKNMLKSVIYRACFLKDKKPLWGMIKSFLIGLAVMSGALQLGLASAGDLSGYPSAFTWMYNFQPEPGSRSWTRAPDGSWTEHYPSGKADLFLQAEAGNVGGCDGMLATRASNASFYVFIPFAGCPQMIARFRMGGGDWRVLGAMENVTYDVPQAAVSEVQEAPAETSGVMALLGAVGQIGAAAGGKNAGKWQAISQSANVQSAAGATGAGVVAAKAATPGTNAQTGKDPFVYSPAVNECLSVEDHPTLVGTKGLRNRCGYKVNYTFCIDNKRIDGSIVDECQLRQFGGDALEGGARTYLLGSTKRITYIACKDPYYIPGSKITVSGDKLTGRCQMAR